MHEHKEPEKDEYGNTKRTFDLKPLKFSRACECLDHVQLHYSIEMDVYTVDAREAVLMLMQGQKPPSEKQWVPILHIKSEYN
jgi:hypothetical protein